MVIIEGPDHSGKSTLIQHILEEFGNQVELSPASHQGPHRNRPAFRDPLAVHERVYGAILNELASQGKVQIHDRLFFSELVYGEVLRGGSTFSWAESVHVNRLLTAISPPIVFCLPPLEVITNKIYGATHMEGVTDNITKIYEAYVALSALRNPRVTLYDYTRGPAAKARICRVIEGYIQRRNSRRFNP